MRLTTGAIGFGLAVLISNGIEAADSQPSLFLAVMV